VVTRDCIAITGKGTPCRKKVIGSSYGFVDSTLDFEHYCGTHIWGHHADRTHQTAETKLGEKDAPNLESQEEVPVLRLSELSLSLIPSAKPASKERGCIVKLTSALEALRLCRRFYPWRISEAKKWQ